MASGELPEGWETTALSDLCDYRREIVMPSRSGSKRYVGLEHLDTGRIAVSRWGSDAEVRSAKHRFHAGDILYGKLRPYLDKAALAEWEGVSSTDILVLTPRSGTSDATYLALRLHAADFLDHANATTEGVNHPRTSWSGISKFEFNAPPLPEQKAIAGVLSRLQGAVEAQDKIITTLKELKAATLAKLFREGLRGEPLKETEIDEIPESWEVVRLGDLCPPPYGTIQTGPFGSQLHASDYESSGVPIINPTHMREGRVVSEAMPLISKENALRLKRHTLRMGDILFSRRGDVGLHAYISKNEEGWLCGTGCLIVRTDAKQIDPLFLSYYLESASPQEYLRSHSVGSIMPNINTTILSSVPVPKPSREEQLEIARALDAVDQVLIAHNVIRIQIASAFKQMLHLLMTGEVHLAASERRP